MRGALQLEVHALLAQPETILPAGHAVPLGRVGLLAGASAAAVARRRWFLRRGGDQPATFRGFSGRGHPRRMREPAIGRLTTAVALTSEVR